MPAEIVTGEFCASYFGEYRVPGSKLGTVYTVSHWGSGAAECTCPAFKFFKGADHDRTCKHVEYVWQHACMWNCQWFDGNEVVDLTAETFLYGPPIAGRSCPNCDGPVVPVKIAV